MTNFYSDIEPLSEYSPVTLNLSPATRVLNQNPGRICSFYLVIILIIPLFTFGSIYRTNILVGPRKIMTETNNSNKIKHNGAQNPNRPEQNSWLLTSLVEEMDSVLPWTNPASGRCRTYSEPPNSKSSTLTTWPQSAFWCPW